MRQELEAALGQRLQNKTLTISHYKIYINNSLALLGMNAYKNTLVGSLMIPSGCKPGDMEGGYYTAEEAPPPGTPIVADLEATLDGKTFKVRKVYTIEQYQKENADGVDILFKVMQMIDAALIEQLRSALPEQVSPSR